MIQEWGLSRYVACKVDEVELLISDIQGFGCIPHSSSPGLARLRALETWLWVRATSNWPHAARSQPHEGSSVSQKSIEHCPAP